MVKFVLLCKVYLATNVNAYRFFGQSMYDRRAMGQYLQIDQFALAVAIVPNH